jgi:hypothetical protein
MRSSGTSKVLFTGLVAGLASVYGCSSGGGNNNVFGGTAGSSGSAGNSGSAGTSSSAGTSGAAGAAGTSGAAGASASAGAGGGASTAGSTGTDGGSAGIDGGTAGAGGMSMMGAAGTSGPLGDITKVLPTAGCGTDPGITAGKTTAFNIQTMGTKPTACGMPGAVPNNCCADSNCAPWSYNRQYFITLPANYDKTKAYPLVLEGPGCGSDGQGVYGLSYMGQNNVNNTVIRVGLTPPPNTIGHATNPGQGCFDDKEGDSSVDWVFYEALYDHLSTTLCFDRNRLFSAGNSSGAWFSNELGCKYAGDSQRPVRGILPNTGGLPNQPQFEPTCTTSPMAGMWIGDAEDPENPFSNNVFAISRAMKVNNCAQSTFLTSNLPGYPNFTIGGGNAASVCKQIPNCPQLYPLVVCLVDNKTHDSHDAIANPGFSTFLTMFENAPLLTQ